MRVTERPCFCISGWFIHRTLLVHVAIVIALVATLLYPHCVRLVHRVTDMMSQSAPLQPLFIVGSEKYNTCLLFYVNSPNIVTPNTSCAHVGAIDFFLKYSDTNRRWNSLDSAQATMTCEQCKCNSLGFWQLQATV
jgi:hypothetical protein